MKLSITWRNALAYFLFMLLAGEAHEMAHFIVGRVICGCWPVERDFNAWNLCDCSVGHFATIAGPIFSMTFSWIGMFMLKNSNIKIQSWGFALIWGNVPQARIMTVLMGGGDEMVFVREITRGTELATGFRWIAVVVVFIMALPPIIAAFKTVKNRWGWLLNIGFMVLPLVIGGLYGFGLLNTLLKNGFLADVWIMGTPLFITLHTLVVLVAFLILFRRDIQTLVDKKP